MMDHSTQRTALSTLLCFTSSFILDPSEQWTANAKDMVGEGGLVNFQVVRGFVVVVLVVDWCNEKDVGGESEKEVLAAGHLQLHRPQPLIQPPITSRALTCIQCKLRNKYL